VDKKDRKDRKPRKPSARRTRGEGVPQTEREEAEGPCDRARPQRGREPRSGRLIVRSRTAREPEGI
jgi:hypothetical protein